MPSASRFGPVPARGGARPAPPRRQRTVWQPGGGRERGRRGGVRRGGKWSPAGRSEERKGRGGGDWQEFAGARGSLGPGRVAEPESRPQRLSRLCPDRPPGLSRAATPRASRPASRRSGGPGTRRRGLREGWWRRGAGQSSRPRLPSGRGPRPSAPAPRPQAPAESAARAAAEPGAPPCRGPPRSCSPASSGFARSCPSSQVSHAARCAERNFVAPRAARRRLGGAGARAVV